MLLAAATGRDAADELGAVRNALFRMERALFTRESLADNASVLVDEDAHIEVTSEWRIADGSENAAALCVPKLPLPLGKDRVAAACVLHLRHSDILSIKGLREAMLTSSRP
jgi:hypothetical protein